MKIPQFDELAAPSDRDLIGMVDVSGDTSYGLTLGDLWGQTARQRPPQDPSATLHMGIIGMHASSRVSLSFGLADRTRVHPLAPVHRIHISSVSFVITTAAVGSTSRIGIFTADPAQRFRPALLLEDFGPMDTGSGGVKTVLTDVDLDPGFYWWATVSSNSAVAPYSWQGYPSIGNLPHSVNNTRPYVQWNSTGGSLVATSGFPSDVSAWVWSAVTAVQAGLQSTVLAEWSEI